MSLYPNVTKDDLINLSKLAKQQKSESNKNLKQNFKTNS